MMNQGEAAQPPEAAVVGEAPTFRVRRWLLVPLALAALFLAGYLPRRAQQERARASAIAGPDERYEVTVVTPTPSERKHPLKLPVTLAPSEQTAIYARASGYVRRWLVDLGDRVRAQQLLAEIDTPELDRELEQARAARAQRSAEIQLARAARDFARESLERYTQLREHKLVSKEQLDQHQAELRISEAKLAIAEAEYEATVASVRRLEQLKAFAEVRAPFAGTITARSVERGALVSAGAATPLFELASLEPLRAELHVPQSQAAGIKPGLEASISVAEYPGRRFRAVVARTAGRLEAQSRTLRVELTLSSAEGRLLPGMYATAEIALERTHAPLRLPAAAVLGTKEGTKVAVVSVDERAHFIAVEVERDLGSEVEIASGLAGDERVIATQLPGVAEGAAVRVVQ